MQGWAGAATGTRAHLMRATSAARGVRRSPEPIGALRLRVALLGDIQIHEVHLPLVLPLEPVHDGRHCLAPQSIGVEA